jgi:hypothetical protein
LWQHKNFEDAHYDVLSSVLVLPHSRNTYITLKDGFVDNDTNWVTVRKVAGGDYWFYLCYILGTFWSPFLARRRDILTDICRDIHCFLKETEGCERTASFHILPNSSWTVISPFLCNMILRSCFLLKETANELVVLHSGSQWALIILTLARELCLYGRI